MNATLQDLYQSLRGGGRAMAHHMPALVDLATTAPVCVEFGIRQGPSTVALLLGGCKELHSYDVEEIPQWHQPILKAAGGRWHPHYESSYMAEPFECDLLMHDSYHNYTQVNLELDRWADYVRRFLVFHDSISCAVNGEGITGGVADEVHKDKMGIRLAIDHLMIRDRSWQIRSHDPRSSGLLVLERAR